MYNDDNDPVIFQAQVKVPEVLVRVFVETLTNAVDNAQQSKDSETPCTSIKVDVGLNGSTSVWNDGKVIPIVRMKGLDDDWTYVHSLIFGHLRTSSNYDKKQDDERNLSGKNGVGVKCTNIFSSYFCVTGVDPQKKLKLIQEWTDNMTKTSGPVVKSSTCSRGFTQVTYVPDFKRFGLSSYPKEVYCIFKKLVVDVSALMPSVKFVFCGEKITTKNLQDYSLLYFPKDEKLDVLTIKHDSSEVVVVAVKDRESFGDCKKFKATPPVSFINGQITKNGGQHVQSWSKAIFTGFLEAFNNGAKKDVKLVKGDITPYFQLFVHSRVRNPIFNGQNKDMLKNPKVNALVTVEQFKKMLKWEVVSVIKTKIYSTKELLTMKQVEKDVKKQSVTNVNSYDAANKTGPDSVLIICEGLSAKAYAVAGIQVGVLGKRGRHHFGIMPLTGKFLNVKNASLTKISTNKVVMNLIKVLNLKHNVDYSKPQNYKTLNYGTVLILTDADKDGIHIKGLIINFFHELFPSLMKKKGFVVSMETPIVKVVEKRGAKDRLFYDEVDFENYRLNSPDDSYTFKYYKGLGTIGSKDVPLFFGKKMVQYDLTDDCDRYVNKVFKDEYTDDRKEWVQKYRLEEPKTCQATTKEGGAGSLTVGDFMELEMIKYSYEDCKRSLASCVDGLKESQRKVIYGIRKKFKKQTDFIKVAQLSGYVAEQTDYKHGEQNLCDTIVKFAQDFVGSNNIPLLEPDGQFGTRLEGGKDAAAPRYIYTRPKNILKYVIREEDDPVLQYTKDGEPVFFVPILPLALINGSVGIGTGWSCFVPQYNPLQVLEHIRQKLTGQVSTLNIVPYYKNFKGKIRQQNESKYVTYGKMKIVPQEGGGFTNVQVTELPIGVWTDKFKDQCNTLLEKGEVGSVVNESTVNEVNFTLKNVDPNKINLTSNLHTSNMVLFDSHSVITKYDNVNSVMEEYFNTRLDFYKVRMKHLLKKLNADLSFSENKLRFVVMVIEDQNVLKQQEDHLVNLLKKKNFLPVDDTFNYLLNIPIRGFTKTAVHKLKNTIERLTNDLENLRRQTPSQMWLNELAEVEPYL
jgi:DNA topoisomerase-2